MVTARSTRSVVICTRANVPGFSLPSGFGTSPSIAKARDLRFTPGAMRTTLPANTCSGKASTLTAMSRPFSIHGANFSGTSAVSFSGCSRTIRITGACGWTNCPGETSRSAT